MSEHEAAKRKRFTQRSQKVLDTAISVWLPTLPVLAVLDIWWHGLWWIIVLETFAMWLLATMIAYDPRFDKETAGHS